MKNVDSSGFTKLKDFLSHLKKPNKMQRAVAVRNLMLDLKDK